MVLEMQVSKIEQWTNNYLRTKQEIEDILTDISCLDGRVFQPMALSFLSIHMCNYFYFTIREILLSDYIPIYSQNKYHVESLFYNDSSIPAPKIMNRYLSIIGEYAKWEKEFYDTLCQNYKELYWIRNKYAHADTDANEIKGIIITQDMYYEYSVNIQQMKHSIDYNLPSPPK